MEFARKRSTVQADFGKLLSISGTSKSLLFSFCSCSFCFIVWSLWNCRDSKAYSKERLDVFGIEGVLFLDEKEKNFFWNKFCLLWGIFWPVLSFACFFTEVSGLQSAKNLVDFFSSLFTFFFSYFMYTISVIFHFACGTLTVVSSLLCAILRSFLFFFVFLFFWNKEMVQCCLF